MSQKEKVLEQIEKNGYVSRNWALQNYITRLSAIIYDLIHNDKMELEGRWKLTDYGKDYVYQLKETPTLTNKEIHNTYDWSELDNKIRQ